ncbi:MAG: response regulator [Candidatus Colwellbacteria bacterium]|nr:response regulator [Candidatus Colwellbacteria bacterium]
MIDNQPRILLFVEDEPDIAELYKITFESEGFIVENVYNGSEAIERLKKYTTEDVNRPNVMILDILLPDISGMEVLHEIRKNPLFDHTPVIMFTNFSSDKVKDEISQIKNTKYLLKMEVGPKQLVAIVKEMLGLK